MRRRTTTTSSELPPRPVVIGAIPALAAPVATIDAGLATATIQHERTCVPESTSPTSGGLDHCGDATYFDNELANPSCSGVPQRVMRPKQCVDGMARWRGRLHHHLYVEPH